MERRKVNLRDNQKRNVIPYYRAWSCTLRSTNRMEKNKWRRRRKKKNRVRCKNAGLQPHSHSTNPFLRSKKGKWRRRQKKIKGYGTSASAASENFKVPSFQSSGRSGGPRARAPKSAQKSPLFFFFFFFFPQKIQNYAMSHNSVYGAISLNFLKPSRLCCAQATVEHLFFWPQRGFLFTAR